VFVFVGGGVGVGGVGICVLKGEKKKRTGGDPINAMPRQPTRSENVIFHALEAARMTL
jgi:hypothetical protein